MAMGRPNGTSNPLRPDGTSIAHDEDAPLTPMEQKFIQEYMRTGNAIQAVKDVGIEVPNERYRDQARAILRRPNVQAEIMRIMNQIHEQSVATAKEVMEYFTAVMRGTVKDQFGLEAPLSERTRAAQEIAKRTVDIDNRRAGEPDQLVTIKLDWSRNK